MKLIWTIVGQNVRARKLRSLLSISGITFGVTILVGILLTNEAVTTTFSNTMVVLAARADLQVTSDWAGLDPQVLERLREDPEIQFAAPVLEVTVNVPQHHEGLLLVGIDFTQDPRVTTYGSFAGRLRIPDLFALVEDKQALIVTSAFLKRTRLDLNDTVEIVTPRGLKPFTIRGLIESEGTVSAMAGNWAIIEYQALRSAFDRSDRPSRIDLFLRSGADAQTVGARLARRLGPAVQVDRPWMRSRPIEKMLEGIQRTLALLGFVALLVGVFLIYNTTSRSVTERSRELGILRACGASRRQIQSLFLLEGALYGVIGAAVGALLGIGAAKGSLAVVSQAISSAYFVFLRVGELHVSPLTIAIGVVFGIGSSVLGAAYPAWAASRLPPLEAILMKRQRTDVSYTLRIALIISLGLVLLTILALVLRAWFGVRFMGYAATGLLMMAFALSAPLTVSLFAKVLFGLLTKWFKIEGRLALENTLRNPTRSGFTTAALILGVAIIVITSGVITSVRDSMARWIGTIFSGDIIIAAHNPFTSGSVSAPLAPSLVADLLTIEGVSRVSAIRYAKVTYGEALISLLAVDGPLPGSVPPTRDSDSVFVSKNFAELFQVRPGDRLPLVTRQGQTEFLVAGSIEDYNYNWPRGTIIAHRETFIKHWADPLVDQLIVYLQPGVEADAVSRAIASSYGPRYNLTVFSNREFRENFMEIIDRQFSLTYAQLLITVAVVLFTVTNTLLISILSRRHEIGVLLAVGATKRQNQRIVVLEAWILGLAGLVYGTVLGLITTLLFIKISLPEETGWLVSYSVPTSGLILGVISALAVSTLGSLLPAREIGRLPVAKLMKYER